MRIEALLIGYFMCVYILQYLKVALCIRKWREYTTADTQLRSHAGLTSDHALLYYYYEVTQERLDDECFICLERDISHHLAMYV